MKHLRHIALAAALLAGAPLAAQPAVHAYQGKSLLGDPMYTDTLNGANATTTATLIRAVADAKIAAQKDPSIDNITWYGRLLGYQLLHREAVAVFSDGLKRYPNSAKLLRHRAQRYLNLREFDLSIADGLKAAALYENQPPEREKLGPDYFTSTPDIVQFYLYYHLGGAFFAKRDYVAAETWFDRAYNAAFLTGEGQDLSACVYWRYLSLVRLNRFVDAKALLDDYKLTSKDMSPTGEAPYYFDAIQLFKGNRSPDDFYADHDSGRPFGTADGTKAATSFTLAAYWLMRGERDKAKPNLARAISVKTWAYFPRIQAEVDWKNLYGNEKP